MFRFRYWKNSVSNIETEFRDHKNRIFIGTLECRDGWSNLVAAIDVGEVVGTAAPDLGCHAAALQFCSAALLLPVRATPCHEIL